MKRILIIILFSALYSGSLWAQSESRTPPASFNIVKKMEPPIFYVLENPYFVDATGNMAIDASENCKIVLKVKNVGYGDGIGLRAVITATGTISGLKYQSQAIPTIKVGKEAIVEFPIIANLNTVDGAVDFTIYIDEPNGFGTDKFVVTVNTRSFVSPMIEVVDYTITGESGGALTKVTPFDLQLLVQNTQYGMGEQVMVKIQLPENVFLLSGEEQQFFPMMAAGEKKSLVYSLIVNNKYEGTEIPIHILIHEKLGKYARNENISLSLNQQLAANKISVETISENRKEIEIASLRSDVDKNIPINSEKNENRFAIIIGNEDYHSSQSGLQTESDVAFAVNDATVFKEYCMLSLGVEERNILFLTNATAAKMKREIALVLQLVKQKGKDAEIIFYYAGHGFPDEATKVPYIIPVDVSGSDLLSAIPLYDLYRQFAETHARRVTVFLDACFSGGGRDAGLLTARAIKVTPREDALSGNLVVFAATQADQTALPYRDKSHGMFTYFLLQKLQQSKGKCSYAELNDFLNSSVGEYSLRVNRKAQTPSLNVAQPVSNIWGDFSF